MTARNEPRAKPDAVEAEPGDGILRIGEGPEEPRREPLFTLDGDEYTVLANPSASLMLRYFNRIRKNGVNLAISWLLEEMIGAGGYKALLESGKVSRDDFSHLANAVIRIVLSMGEETVPK